MTQLIHFSAQKMRADGFVDQIDFGIDVRGWSAEEDPISLLQTICQVEWSAEEDFLTNAIPRYIMSVDGYSTEPKQWAIMFQEPGADKASPLNFGVICLASNLDEPVEH